MRSCRTLLLAALLVGAASFDAGCAKKTAKKDEKGNAPQQPAPMDQKPIIPDPTGGGGGGGAAMHIARGKEIQINKNDLGQFALSFNQVKQLASGPITKADLQAEVARQQPKLWKLIEEGKVIVNYNAELNSTSIIAYEKSPDLNGNHLVVFGDRHIENVPSARLQQIVPRQ